MQEAEGKYWPAESDRVQRVYRYHVPKSPLVGSPEQYVPGTTVVEVIETPAAVSERLQEQFPLYRLAQWAGRVTRLVGAPSEV